MNIDPLHLFPRYSEVAQDLDVSYLLVELSEIDPTPIYQLRPLDPQHVAHLKQGIRALGNLLSPLILTSHPDTASSYTYALLDGHHRLAAMLELADEYPSFAQAPAYLIWSTNNNVEYTIRAASLWLNLHNNTLDKDGLPLYFLRYLGWHTRNNGALDLQTYHKYLTVLDWVIQEGEALGDVVAQVLEYSPVDPPDDQLPGHFKEVEARYLLYLIEAFFEAGDWKATLSELRLAMALVGAIADQQALLQPSTLEDEQGVLALLAALRENRPLNLPLPWRGSLAELSAHLEPRAKTAPVAVVSRSRGATRGFTLEIPPFAPRLPTVRKTLRNVGKALTLAARMVAKEQMKDQQFIEAAQEMYQVTQRFLTLVAASAPRPLSEEPQVAPEDAQVQEQPNELLEQLTPQSRNELARELLEEEEIRFD